MGRIILSQSTSLKPKLEKESKGRRYNQIINSMRRLYKFQKVKNTILIKIYNEHMSKILFN